MQNCKDEDARQNICERTEALGSSECSCATTSQSDAHGGACTSTASSDNGSLSCCNLNEDLDEFACDNDLSDSDLLLAAESFQSMQDQLSQNSGDVNLGAGSEKKKVFMFGLLGTDSEEDIELSGEIDEEKINLFCRLPDEVIENIFCQLPIIDLLLNCAPVCRHWKSVISSDTFIPWKKRYYKFKKKKDRGIEDSVVRILDDNGLYEEEFLPYYLARFMENFRRVDSVSVSYLKEHPKFCLIQSFVASFFSSPGKEPSPWSLVGLLVLVSSTVKDVTDVITCMEKSNLCLVHDVIESLYCLATIFFALQIQNRISPGLHYRIFYALYLYENSTPCHMVIESDDPLSAVDGARSLSESQAVVNSCPKDRIHLTHEQKRIVKHKILPGEMIKVIAFAGTGKTTTLAQLTQRNPNMSFLNLAYNSSVQQQAERIFPSNVTCKTVHAWAYKFMWKQYRHKLEHGKFGTGKISNILPKSHFLHSRRIEETLNNFIASSDPVVSDQHVPPLDAIQVLAEEDFGNVSEESGNIEDKEYNYYDSERYIKKVVKDTAYIWKRMVDPKDKGVGITHDGYLKVYQLSKPTITGFDCLLIDEAQDCTPAVTDIFLRQRCSKILVGDPNQQIYGFRGARNAIREAQANRTFFLTQSFRFGPDIAYVAATLLHVFKDETRNTLVGSDKDSGIFGDQVGQLAIITRSNFTLFNEASAVACEDNKLKIAFAGGLEKFGLDRVLDIHKLFTAGSVPTACLGIKDKFIKNFKNFQMFKAYAKKARDAELLGKIKIVETHHVMVPERVKKIRSKNTPHMEQADIVFSTVHKAKGLEFDTVRLTNDFLLMDTPLQYNGAGTETAGPREDDECNLLYVAVTRAKKRLQVTKLLLRLLGGKKEYFLRATSTQKVLQANTECVRCKDVIDFSASNQPHVVVERPEITFGSGDGVDGGILCPPCALKNIGYLGCMISLEHRPRT